MLKRTHNCGQLRLEDAGKKVALSGWVHSYRDHGNLVFIDLRDREGLTQIVFDPETQPEMHKLARTIRCEWVVAAEGLVRPRSEGMANPKLATGEIEVLADRLEILNTAKTPPFEIDSADKTGEELRLIHRYIDLRRPEMQSKLRTRHQVTKITRDYFDEKCFWEIETPMLAKSTPEGARDFLVPSTASCRAVYPCVWLSSDDLPIPVSPANEMIPPRPLRRSSMWVFRASNSASRPVSKAKGS